MVLEGISSSPSADFADGAPASDNDPYSSSSTRTHYNIDATSFPRPIPIIGRLLGYTEEKYTVLLTKRLEQTEKGVQRELTDNETNAIAYYAAKQIAIFSYATPVGWAGAIYRWNATKAVFRFPFFQPDLAKLDIESFPTTKFAFLKGQLARNLWSGTRLACYGIVAVPIAQLLFGSYSASVVTVGTMSDPRMKQIIESIQAKAKNERGAIRQQAGRAGQQSQASKKTPVDDASPTGGMSWEEPVIADTSSTMSGPTQSIQSAQSTQSTQSNQSRPSQPPTSMPSMGRVEMEKARSPFDTADDAPPTNGQGISSDIQPASKGSAWDKLRRGGNTKSGSLNTGAWQRQQHQNETPDGHKQGDAFTISRSDEDRSYAKEEAQREFDARVERERRVGDFGSGNGDQKRW